MAAIKVELEDHQHPRTEDRYPVILINTTNYTYKIRYEQLHQLAKHIALNAPSASEDREERYEHLERLAKIYIQKHMAGTIRVHSIRKISYIHYDSSSMPTYGY